MPVGEGSTGEEVLFYIVKGPLDPGLGLNRQLLPYAKMG